MRKLFFSWEMGLGVSLILLSMGLYWADYFVFGGGIYIFNVILQDIAFVPIQVLLVSLIIDKVLAIREKRAMLQKMNMVIGTFFYEVGLPLLKYIYTFEEDPSKLSLLLKIEADWPDRKFSQAQDTILKHDFVIKSSQGNLACLSAFITEKREVLLRLLENPNLLEHETFTDLLWAVFHLSDELSHREVLTGLPETDYEHLAADIKRVYSRLIVAWLEYMKHLKSDYPYLYALAVRTNPFLETSSPIVQESGCNNVKGVATG